MNPPNIKIYLAVSGVLIILFLFVTFYPFGKPSSHQQPVTNLPTPTTIDLNQSPFTNNPTPTLSLADFTGVAEEEIPPKIIDSAIQKQTLRDQVPFDTGLFQIDFDYGEDKFIVTLYEPKTENKQQFNQWLKENYPDLAITQFNFK